jgi:hypothetical protein
MPDLLGAVHKCLVGGDARLAGPHHVVRAKVQRIQQRLELDTFRTAHKLSGKPQRSLVGVHATACGAQYCAIPLAFAHVCSSHNSSCHLCAPNVVSQWLVADLVQGLCMQRLRVHKFRLDEERRDILQWLHSGANSHFTAGDNLYGQTIAFGSNHCTGPPWASRNAARYDPGSRQLHHSPGGCGTPCERLQPTP